MTALYTATGAPIAQVRGTSASLRNEFLLIQAGFAALPVSAYAADTGTANAYVIAVSSVITAYADGLQVIFKASHANTGASTVNVNGLGAIAIVHQDGTALVIDDIYSGQFVVAIYNATTNQFVLAGSAMGQILADITAQVAASQATLSAQITAAAFQTALPAQSGNAGKLVTTNGTAASWVNVPVVDTVDATITASTTLSGSLQYVPVAMATVNQTITLPDATTLLIAFPQYIIRNNGTNAFVVRDNSGVLIASVPVRATIFLMLSANGTAAGTWSVGNASEFEFLNMFSAGSSSIVEAASISGYPFSIAQLTASSFIVGYTLSSTNYPRACVLTISGNTITPGTPVDIESIANAYGVSVAAISATQVIATYCGASGYPRACILNISSSTTITPATPVTIQAVSSSVSGVVVSLLTSTQAIALFSDAPGFPVSAILNISGSTITPVASVLITTAYTVGGVGYLNITSLSSTSALAIFYTAGSSSIAVILTVAGSVITVNTVTLFTSSQYQSLSILSPTLAVVSSRYSAPLIVALSISGTAITAGTPVSIAASGTSTPSVIATSSTTGRVYYSVGNVACFQTFIIAGTTVSLSQSINLGPINVGTFMTAVNNSINMADDVLLYVNASNYISAILAEYVK